MHVAHEHACTATDLQVPEGYLWLRFVRGFLIDDSIME